jgi:FKBP-type peptidyl-prolyl cis-trans isomerase
MKHTALIALAALAGASTVFAADTLKDQTEKTSYSLGVNIGKDIEQNLIKRGEFEVKPELLVKGITDGIVGNKPLLSEEEMQKTLNAFQTEMRSKMEARQKELEAKQKAEGEKNKAAGEKFLSDNKAKQGVKTTASGLQYEVLTEGKGEHPKATDTVTVHYTGKLIDGTEFDSSVKRGEPATFPLNQVIPGWTEGVQLMSLGSKYHFTIPANLAYGEQAPPPIGPNQVLTFDVELLKIEKGGEKAQDKAD